MNCWICGLPANTGEHKIKKSLLVALHGCGPYHKNQEMLHYREGRMIRLQGPNADQIKFDDSLCAKCNNSGTQVFDQAYDKFFDYVLKNESLLLSRRVLDFRDVYGDDFEAGQTNLYKYFVKLFGCDVVASGHSVPTDLPALLGVNSFLTKLRISFAINEDKLILPETDRPVGIGDLFTSQRNLKSKDDPKYMWTIYFSFLHIFFWYDWVSSNEPSGASWTADSRFLYFGWFAPLDSDRREELKRKITEQTI